MSTPSKLSQLRELSVVVADTGDYEAIKRLQPVDCTTNPTLVKKALDLPVYAELIERELAWGRQQGGDREAVVHAVADRLTIGVGALLSTLVPGRVSTEVDADQAYDTAATVLQAEGIDCNLTLIFNPTQALACSEAGAFLISPFVGRILDWYVANGQTPANIDEDPGVVFVRGVYAEFKRRGSPTVVMGASFRSTAQIEALAGCDRLTISPDLLEKLDADHGVLPRKLVAGAAEAVQVTPIDAAKFAADLAADPMATEKLATGIDAFAKDLEALRQRIREAL